MTTLNTTGLTKAATCFLKAVEALEQVSLIKIVGQPQYGQPVAGDADYKSASRNYEAAAQTFHDAGLAYAASDFEAGARLEKKAGRKLGTASRLYRRGYKACCGR